MRDEDREHLLEALLAVSPQDLGYPHVSWTVPLLREVLEIATEQRVSDDTLRRAVHRLDYVWKRPRYDLDPDPEREKKTPHSPANPGSSAAQCRVGSGRNRPVAVPAVARHLVEARRTGSASSASPPQRQSPPRGRSSPDCPSVSTRLSVRPAAPARRDRRLPSCLCLF